MPCSQFFNQEPSSDPTELANGIRWVRPGNDFNLEFPIFVRSEINGKNRLPLYRWLTSRCPSPVPQFGPANLLLYEPISQEDIRWNFEKILFDRDGQPYRRYASSVTPPEIEDDITFLLAQ